MAAGDPITEARMFLRLGSMLNGHPNIAHGGAQSFMLDESMALLLTCNKNLIRGPIRIPTVTAYLKVSFHKAVQTPSVVLVTSTLREVNGRKHFIDSTIKDANGAILADAEALFVAIRTQKEKL